ncbi:uncharacterized protein LOC116616875 [Nematostella vectensis]|uniref:uncharacterized protein LOC116616875 n=1 Tax=Nematostella vectensis TaxID=45351 RepID=UPI0013904374|nr:uncharacterized protein LOC116616875 [Nematostella vectensis]XP_032234883.1 uncharacterized protein LOC116616875 [Nematostella vectensis]
MGCVLTKIRDWAKAAWNRVKEGLKWLWHKIKNLFSSMADLFFKLFGLLRERENDRQVQQNHINLTQNVTIESDRSSLRAGNNDEGSRPRHTSESRRVHRRRPRLHRHPRRSPQNARNNRMIEALGKAEDAFRDMRLIMTEDAEHENSELTNQRLQDFYRRHDVDQLQREINSLSRVNPVL